MGRQGRIEITLFRRQTTFLYSQAKSAGLDSPPVQRDETEKPFQAQPWLMPKHDFTPNQDTAQDGMKIASLAQQIDDVLQMGKNNQAALGRKSGLVGTGS